MCCKNANNKNKKIYFINPLWKLLLKQLHIYDGATRLLVLACDVFRLGIKTSSLAITKRRSRPLTE